MFFHFERRQNCLRPARYKGTKHMERRYFALQQTIAAKIAQLMHIRSEDNPADLGATFKTIREFKHLRTLIMGLDFDKNRPTSLTLKAGKAYSSDAIGDGPGIVQEQLELLMKSLVILRVLSKQHHVQSVGVFGLLIQMHQWILKLDQ